MAKQRKLLLLGGGGHCRCIIDSIQAFNNSPFMEIGIIDYVDKPYQGVDVIGNDDDLKGLFEDGWTDAFVAVGSIGNTSVRHKLYQLITEIGFEIPCIIDPTAKVSKSAVVGKGVYIGKGAIVNSAVLLGDCCIINSGAIVEHDCEIGSFSHISPGSVLCGEVRIGSDSHVGAGSTIIQQTSVGNNTLVGAGSVLVKDLPDNVKAYGNPCKVIE